MADLNGDGFGDIISGSWPGDIYWFPGAEGRTFRAREILIPAGSMTADNVPEGVRPIEGYSLTSAGCVSACDWDGDGDIDFLVGTILGMVCYFENTGTATQASFAAPVTMAWQGMPEGRYLGRGVPDTGTAVGDWDLDGDLDLIITGHYNRSLSLYRNVGTRQAPVLAAPETLSLGNAPLQEGSRMKVCIADYNADGLPDLIIGNMVVAEMSQVTGHVWVSLRSREPQSADDEPAED